MDTIIITYHCICLHSFYLPFKPGVNDLWQYEHNCIMVGVMKNYVNTFYKSCVILSPKKVQCQVEVKEYLSCDYSGLTH